MSFLSLPRCPTTALFPEQQNYPDRRLEICLQPQHLQTTHLKFAGDKLHCGDEPTMWPLKSATVRPAS